MDDRQRQTAAHYRVSIPAFHDVWAPVLAALTRPLLDRISLETAARRLEVGCGIGLILRAMTDRAPAGAVTIGADLLPEMLTRARDHAPAAGLVRLDAARLPFGDASFDLVFSAFTWHHLREQLRALAEAQRVLRPGGRLALLTWSDRDDSCTAFDLWEELLNEFGAPEDDPDPTPTWHAMISTPEALTALLSQAGFAAIDVAVETGQWTWSPDDLLRYRTEMGPSRRRLEKLPPARRVALVRKARAAIERLEPGDLTWRATFLLATARRADDAGGADADYRTVCPNCGTVMYDRGCKTRCPKCHFFTDCSDPW